MLVIAILIMFLAGCADKKIEVHENVDEQLAADTIKVLDILDKHLKKNNKPNFSEEDEEFLNDYINTYAPKKAYKQSPKLYQEVDPPFTTDDLQVYLRTETQVLSFGPMALLDEDGNYVNGDSSFSWIKEEVLDVIENGLESN